MKATKPKSTRPRPGVMGPKQRAIAALSRPLPRGKRVSPVARDKELRKALLEVAKICEKHGIRLTAGDPSENIAVFDAMNKRPPRWPVAAYVAEIGNGRLKGFSLQSIMPYGADEEITGPYWE